MLCYSLPYGSAGKESTCNARDRGDVGSIAGLRRSPAEGNGIPFQCFLAEKSHGQKRLVVYSSWGHKELDTTE